MADRFGGGTAPVPAAPAEASAAAAAVPAAPAPLGGGSTNRDAASSGPRELDSSESGGSAAVHPLLHPAEEEDADPPPAAPAPEREEEGDRTQRLKNVIRKVADGLVCHITHELPYNPVFCEDGRIYERRAIQAHIRTSGHNLRSPYNNEPMGPSALPAVQVRNSIRALVGSGALDEDMAEYWHMRRREEATVEETKAKAEAGDADAMCRLGDWYYHGHMGLLEDDALAYTWYKRAADLHSVRGMADAGELLEKGHGVLRDVPLAIALTSAAAGMGSDAAAYNLGSWYRGGECGLPRDVSQMAYWYHRVVDGGCSVRHLDAACIGEAEGYLRAHENGEISTLL